VNIEVIQEFILPMVNQLIDDRIPNIRFNVAKSYGVLIGVLRQLPAEGTLTNLKPEEIPTGPSPAGLELIQKNILPNLEKLRGDQDRDVRYFAEQAFVNSGDFMLTS
jgi:serine/threonine-protein phosphatase 2A regulatory subunit A